MSFIVVVPMIEMPYPTEYSLDRRKYLKTAPIYLGFIEATREIRTPVETPKRPVGFRTNDEAEDRQTLFVAQAMSVAQFQ